MIERICNISHGLHNAGYYKIAAWSLANSPRFHWDKQKDEASGKTYNLNSLTGETTFDRPTTMASRRSNIQESDSTPVGTRTQKLNRVVGYTSVRWCSEAHWNFKYNLWRNNFEPTKRDHEKSRNRTKWGWYEFEPGRHMAGVLNCSNRPLLILR